MDTEGVTVGTGMETNIGIKRTIISKLSSPYSSCVNGSSSSSNDSLLYKEIFALGQKTYRQKYCFKLCYQYNLIINCKCYDPQFPSIASVIPEFSNQTVPGCHDTEQVSCMSNQQTYFDEYGTSNYTNCSRNCPLECESVNYDLRISTATYPTSNYLKWLLLQTSLTQKYSNQTTLLTDIQNSILKLNIFYDDMFYTKLSDSPAITSDTLLGTIGGNMALFLGISFLSFVEVMELFYEIVKAAVGFKFKNNSKNKVNQQNFITN